MATDCLFCKMASGAIDAPKLHDDDLVFAVRDINPRAPVHVLIVPKQHIDDARRIEPEHGPILARMVTVGRAIAGTEGVLERGYRLTFNVGYLFGIDYFENTSLSDYDLQYHQFDLRASWRFFPKTALYIAANETINIYQHPGASQHPDSFPLHVDAGMQGLITPKLTVNAWIGYGNGFYQWPSAVMTPHPNPNTAIGGLSRR